MESVTCKDVFHSTCIRSNFIPVNIEFENLSYTIDDRGEKQILKSISGEFRSGDLTGILGASGSGKSTLLNVLSGNISGTVSGSIRINGMSKSIRLFSNISAYIMQDDVLQSYLKVEEMMMISAKLKLNNDISLMEKQAIITRLLRLFNLEETSQTLTDNLSGGQKRRLSIALEMISNPSVLFLDEPTSGLDSVSANDCLGLLKMLSEQGKTIICTIHQPSAFLLQSFQQVYFIQNGMCVYNGSPSNIIPFMSSLGYECPVDYNPADYIIETVETIKESVGILTQEIVNGLSSKFTNTQQHNGPAFNTNNLKDRILESSFDFPTPFWTQFTVLLSRMMLQMTRNTLPLWILFFEHLIVAIFIGLTYYQIGNNGTYAIQSFLFGLCDLIFFVYTYGMIPALLFPMELQIIKKEFFNRWYCLKPYFLAMTLRNIPVMMLLGLMFVIITYLLTGQLLELHRLGLFFVTNILTGLIAESMGLLIGSTCNIKIGAVVSPISAALLLIISFYGTGYGYSVSSLTKVLMKVSYIRVGMIAMSQAIFGNRDLLECMDDLFCYYKDPNKLLVDIGTNDESCALHILLLVVYFVVLRICAFLAMKLRLTSEVFSKVINFFLKLQFYISKY